MEVACTVLAVTSCDGGLTQANCLIEAQVQSSRHTCALQVQQLYFRLDSEAGTLEAQPKIASVKIKKRRADCEPAHASTRVVLSETCMLKVPKSVDDDPQVACFI